jgi:membrane fusion protein (multidrug efflux system)
MRFMVPAFAALVALACGGGGGELAELPEGEAPGAAPVEPVTVQVAAVERRRITPTVRSVGTAEPLRAANLGPQIGGRITHIYVEEGDVVDARDRLVRIDSRSISTGRDRAAANVEAAESQVQQLEQELTRLRPLAANGTVPQQQVDTMSLQLDAARAQLAAARTGVRDARNALGDATIRAPFAGIISNVMMEVGETALMQPPSIVLRLVDLSAVEISTQVPEIELATLGVGVPATVHFRSLDADFEGQITRISPEVDRRTRTVEVVVRVDNPDGRIRGGLSADVTLRPGEPRNALVVPRLAARGLGDARRVYVVEGDRAVERAVRVQALGDDLEVLEGLSGDERVVSPLPPRLGDGSPVRVQEADAPPEEGAPSEEPAPSEESAP